jgi:hypothetical protein
VTLFTSYDRVATATVLRQFPPEGIVTSLDVDSIGTAQTSDSSLLLLYVSSVVVLRAVLECEEARLGTSVGSASDPRSYHSVENLGCLVARKFREESIKFAEYFPFFASPGWTIIHYNKRASAYASFCPFFVKASVRRNKRKRHHRMQSES